MRENAIIIIFQGDLVTKCSPKATMLVCSSKAFGFLPETKKQLSNLK